MNTFHHLDIVRDKADIILHLQARVSRISQDQIARPYGTRKNQKRKLAPNKSEELPRCVTLGFT